MFILKLSGIQILLCFFIHSMLISYVGDNILSIIIDKEIRISIFSELNKIVNRKKGLFHF